MSGRGTAGGPVIRPSRNLIVFCVDCSCTAVARCSFHPATYLSTRNRIWQDSKSDPFSKWWKVMLIFNAIIVGSLIQTTQCQGILYGYAVQVESQSSIRIFNRVILFILQETISKSYNMLLWTSINPILFRVLWINVADLVHNSFCDLGGAEVLE